MNDTAPQTARGKLLMHFTMSIDGFVAGPNHEMDWVMAGFSSRPGLIEEYVETTGAILGGRDGWDAFPDPSATYGGAWSGPLFVLTHHPEDATPADGVTFLNCGAAEAVAIALEAAGGKNVEVFSPTIGRRLLQLGLIDEFDLHIARSSWTESASTTVPAVSRSSSSEPATERCPKSTCGIDHAA